MASESETAQSGSATPKRARSNGTSEYAVQSQATENLKSLADTRTSVDEMSCCDIELKTQLASCASNSSAVLLAMLGLLNNSTASIPHTASGFNAARLA